MARDRLDMNHAIGSHKVSATFLRKTEGDLLVSQFSSERWFKSEEAAIRALGKLLEVFQEPEASLDAGNGGQKEQEEQRVQITARREDA